MKLDERWFLVWTYCILISHWVWTCRFSAAELPWGHLVGKDASADERPPVRNPWRKEKETYYQGGEVDCPQPYNLTGQ